jgi:hypothetical protein
MRSRSAWFAAALLLAGCEASTGPAEPAVNRSPLAVADGAYEVRTAQGQPLPMPIYAGTAPARCDEGDRTHFTAHRGRMEIQGESFRFTLRVSENCWDWDRRTYYSPQPAFRDVVAQGRVAPFDGVDEPGATPPGTIQGQLLRFFDPSTGTDLYHGRVNGDSLYFGAQNGGGDHYLSLRIPG